MWIKIILLQIYDVTFLRNGSVRIVMYGDIATIKTFNCKLIVGHN